MRQSLAVVMALVSLVEAAPLKRPAVLGHLEQIRREMEWMKTTVLNLHAGSEKTVDVGEVASQVWAATADCVTCAFRLVREGRAMARVDEGDLRRSVRNLVANAVRAAGPAGRVELRVYPDGGTIVIEVADDGPGFGNIPPQQGLGLITVRRFAAAVDGRLTVGTSSLGGALLRLEVPSGDGVPDPAGGHA